MSLQDLDLKTILAQIGRAEPAISGSTAALVAAQLGAAMIRVALAVSHRHGSDIDMVVERLDSIVSRIRQATENDRAASTELIDSYRQDADPVTRSSALTAATREPLAAAFLLTELLESLEVARSKVAHNLMSDFAGGIELISAAFRAVMMAVENNLDSDGTDKLRERMSSNRSNLLARFDLVMKRLRPEGSS